MKNETDQTVRQLIEVLELKLPPFPSLGSVTGHWSEVLATLKEQHIYSAKPNICRISLAITASSVCCYEMQIDAGGSAAAADGGDFQINGYGHQEIDRFGILLDLWTNEATFLDAKKEVQQLFFLFLYNYLIAT